MVDVDVFIMTGNRKIKVDCIEVNVKNKRNTASAIFNFSFLFDGLYIQQGSNVILSINKNHIFNGFIFKSYLKNGVLYCTAFDRLKYLFYRDSMIVDNYTISSFIFNICRDKLFDIGYIENENININGLVFNNTTYLDMINRCINYTKDYTGRNYVFYDFNGKLYFRDCYLFTSKYAITQGDNLIEYSFSKDIIKGTFNTFKFVRENIKNGIKDVFIKENKQSQKQIGTLQYYKKVNDKITNGEINRQIDILYNNKTIENSLLKIKCFADTFYFIGMTVKVVINDAGITGFFIIDEINYIFKNGSYFCEMSLLWSHL
ncbi:MAG: XkdQ/YqbQ family protein [Oscillospiraceae bacterium]